MSSSPLPVYLNDHLAMMTSEVELAERVAGENDDAPLGSYLRSYASEVERQRAIVERILEAAGGSQSTVKQAAGWLAEKLGRLKLNDSLVSYSDLSRLVELEALQALAQSRLSLWRALLHLRAEAKADDIPSLEQTTSRQLDELLEHHQQAVSSAFASETLGSSS